MHIDPVISLHFPCFTLMLNVLQVEASNSIRYVYHTLHIVEGIN